MRFFILVSLLFVPLTLQAQTLVAGNTTNGPADMPTSDHLLNINQTPKTPRFLNLEKKWPEKGRENSAGDAELMKYKAGYK